MNKVTLDLGSVSKGMKLKLCFILNSQTTDDNGVNKKMISNYIVKDMAIFTVLPRPFITIDISKAYPSYEYNANLSINLNMKAKMILESSLDRMIREANTINELFFKNRDNYGINNDVAKAYMRKIECNQNRFCYLEYGIVPRDEEVPSSIDLPGIIFTIENYDTSLPLTFQDASYLLYMLKNTNMMQLVISLTNTYLMCKGRVKSTYLRPNPSLKDHIQEDYVVPPVDGRVYKKPDLLPPVIPNI